MLRVRVNFTVSRMSFSYPFNRFGAVVAKDVCVDMVTQMLIVS